MAEPFRKDGLSYFKDPSRGGALVSVPDGTAPSSLLIPVSQADLEADARRQQAESALGIAETVASSALSGASSVAQQSTRWNPLGSAVEGGLSLMDPKEREALPLDPTNVQRPLWQQLAGTAGYDEKALGAREKELREVNPVSGFVGEIGGQAIAPSPLGMAKGLAAKVGMGALEGAGWGSVEADTQARLDGTGVATTAERVSAMLLGGVFGGATGGLIHGGERIFRRAPKVAGAVATEAAGATGEVAEKAPLSFVDKAAQKLGDLQVKYGGADKEAMDLMGVGSTHPQRDMAREVVNNPGRSLKQSADELGGALEVTSKTEDRIHEYLGGEDLWREETVNRLVGDGPRAPMRQASADTVADLRTRLQAKIEFIDKEMGQPHYTSAGPIVNPRANRLREFGKELAELETGLRATPGSEGAITATEGYTRLNAFKRSMSSYVKSMPAVGDAGVKLGGAGELIDDMRLFLSDAHDPTSLYAPVRNFLEDTSVWGRAGTLQRELNDGVHQMIQFSGKYESELGNRIGRDFRTGKSVWRPDKAKMEGAASLLGQHPDGEFAIQFRDRMDGLERSVRVLKEMGVTGFGDLDEASASIAKARKEAATSVERAHWLDLHREGILGAQRNADQLKMTNPATMGVMGAWAGGPVGAAAGLGASLLFRPAGAMQAAHQIRKATNRIMGSRIEKEARAVVSGARSVGEQKSGLVRRAVSRVPAPSGGLARAASVGGVAAFLGGEKTLESAFDSKVEQVKKFRDPLALTEAIISAAPGLNEDPELLAATVAQAQRTVEYLAAKIPGGTEPASMFSQPARPSRGAMQKWAQDWTAAMDPLAALSAASTGRVTPAQVEALKSLHPETYKEIQAHVMDEAARYASESKIPYRVAQQLDILLSLGGTGVPQLSLSTSRQIMGGVKAKRAARQQKTAEIGAMDALPEASYPSMK